MSERLNQLVRTFQDFFERSSAQRIFMPYLLAKKSEEFYRLSTTQSQRGNEIFSELVRQYAIELSVHQAEYGVYDFYAESPETCLLSKSFENDELTFFEALHNFSSVDLSKFLLNQYPLEFFCIEIPLNRTQSIHLFQHVPGSYRAQPKRPSLFIQMFEGGYEIQVTKYDRGFNLGKDFNFCSFYDSTDPSQCFSIIIARTRKWFEKMYGYIQQYRVSFDEFSQISVLDLSIIGLGTEETWRQCHSLLRSPNYEPSLIRFREALLSSEYNPSKRYLDGKGIPYSAYDGRLIVTPQNVYQTKILIKMLKDNLVKTQYLERDGLANNIDVV